MQSQMQDQDVFIKDEGYAAVNFLSDKAKEIAHSLEIPNSLQDFGDTYLGKPVWNKDTKKGLYQCAYNVCYIDEIIQTLTDKGLKVESEI